MEKAIPVNTGSAGQTDSGASPKRVNHIIVLACALIVLNALLTHSYDSRTSKTLKVGDTMPAYSLTAIGGELLTGAKATGKPALYYFYANWCPCSHQSINHIKRAFEDNKDAGLIAIAIGVQDSEENLEKFAKTHQLPFPAVAEGGAAVGHDIGVTITPTTLFVDKDGVIRSVYIGKVDLYDQLTDGLRSILPSASGAV